MRKVIFLLIPLTGLFLFFTCEREETEEVVLKTDQDIIGKWQLYETGYSPGGGYVTDKVDPIPMQSITLKEGNHFSSNIEGLESFQYYYVLDGLTDDQKILALFTNEQNPDRLKIDDADHSYSIDWDKGNLKLHFRYCIEGCHMAFKKIKGDSKL